MDEITRHKFDEILSRYSAFVKSISKPGKLSTSQVFLALSFLDSKVLLIFSLMHSLVAKKDDEGLEQLDKFRYEEAPSKYCQPDPKNTTQRLIIPFATEDLQKLVAWKLKHGKFRPQLLKLASSNTQTEVTKTTKEAFTLYEKDPSNPSTILAATKKLSELKGIGPATASLLLSIHDKDNVLFFSDEVFLWLCREGKKDPEVAKIKYNFKEYEELIERGGAVIGKLGKEVSAMDVERVGFVIMKEGSGEDSEKVKKQEKKSSGADEKKEDKKRTITSGVAKKIKGEKRKNVEEDIAKIEPRRSKRGKNV